MNINYERVSNSTTKDQKKGNKSKKKDEKSLKVVYISTPMKVRTSSARFRTLVQELTGKNSDIAGYMDTYEGAAGEFQDDYEFLLANEASGHRVLSSSISSDDMNASTTTTMTTTTPTTSDSFMGPTDNVYTFQMEEQYVRAFSSEYSCCDPSQLDVLGSYDDLII